MRIEIVCTGIGGRGVLLASTVLMEAAVRAGCHTIVSDEYGMSQRGGSVVSLVKIGEFRSPLIGRENADILLTFEESEFYRNLAFLKKGGFAIINTSKNFLPEGIQALLKSRNIDAFLINADSIAMDKQAIQASNMALLGHFSRLSVGPFTFQNIRDTIRERTKGKFVEKNLEVFDAGYKYEATSPAMDNRMVSQESYILKNETTMPQRDANNNGDTRVMIGNYAIARGLVEAGIDFAAAYPGTPSSEIIPGIIEFNKRERGHIHAEWSTNERCAFEAAFGAASAGKKAACMMKQVGLNVAFPPFLHSREKILKGALVIVSCDDPGPQSSQTEQDTRLIATLYGVPVFDPASPKEAADAAYYAIQYSYERKTPVIVRSTHRVSHAREAVPIFPPGRRKAIISEGIYEGGDKVQGSGFRVQGSRFKVQGSESQFKIQNSKFKIPAKLGMIASGMSFSIAVDVISELGLESIVPVYKVLKIPGLRPPASGLNEFVNSMDSILVLEETDSVLEALIDCGGKVFGRQNGYVPSAGELTYDVVRDVIEKVTAKMGIGKTIFTPDLAIEESLKEIHVPPRPPKLCAGCPHRATFYAMKCAYPDAVFPGDIGCYTLGTTMGAVDTCIDMGGGVNLASGFYDTFNQDGTPIPIMASIGDSTFFHACQEPLYDAVKKRKRFVLVIMDNATTAMTGMQPTPQSGIAADGSQASSIKIEDI
ncbi:MAG: hypothetical protein A3K22_01135, partial [Deltaproteobacteria bacterium RBG_16_42_7]